MENNLQEFMNQEKQENNGIDQQEVQLLDQLVHNNNKELNEEVKNILTPENSNLLIKQINTFLKSDNGKKIDTIAQQHYINILTTLSAINKNINIKNFIEETKNLLSESKMDSNLSKSLFDNIKDKNWQQINWLDEGNLWYMINNFIAQFNTHNTENKITNKLFSQEDLYTLPTARKDAFATKLAQMTFRVEQNNNKRNGSSNQAIEQAIRNYRQEFFNKCFKNGETIPPLRQQENKLLWDKWGETDWILKWEKIQAADIQNVAWFTYERESFSSNNNTIDRKNGQETLDVAVLADWIDRWWVDITIRIDEKTTIKWYTKWIFPDQATRERFMKSSQAEKDAIVKNLSNEDKKNTTVIIWDNAQQLPTWVSLNTGGIHIDAKKFWSKPKVSLDVTSPERNDETFVTINTNGRLNKEGFAGSAGRDVLQQNLFENGLHTITETEAAKLNITINDIKQAIKENRITNQWLLLINVESTTDKNQIVESLHIKLKQDLIDLRQSFLTLLETKYWKVKWWEKFTEIQSAMALKVKDRDDSDGNKVLAQCRAYEGMQYIINNLWDENLNKIAFNINNIQWNQPQRSFSLYTLWEMIKLG